MAHTFKVTVPDDFYDMLQERAEWRGEDPEDTAALAADLVKVAKGRIGALHKHQRKIAAVRADPLNHGQTFEPRVPFLAPDALDVQRLVALGVAPAKANGAAPKAEAPKASKAKAPKAAKARKVSKAQTALPLEGAAKAS